jgi:hypothetical protein
MSTISELEELVDSLRLQLREAEHALREAKLAAAPVHVGDIVRSGGKLYRVTHVDVEWTRPWLKGNPQRKDGSYGTAERHLYHGWTLVEPEPAP